MGRRAVTITWTGQNVSAETAPWVPETLRPGSMLADIILIYWPEAAVRRALPDGARCSRKHTAAPSGQGKARRTAASGQ